MRGKQPGKKRQQHTYRREHARTDGELAQTPPLNERLLKARQPGQRRFINIEIDLHTTPECLRLHGNSLRYNENGEIFVLERAI
ncbi:hypothetical protein D3C87_1656650 [compost metagenome]